MNEVVDGLKAGQVHARLQEVIAGDLERVTGQPSAANAFDDTGVWNSADSEWRLFVAEHEYIVRKGRNRDDESVFIHRKLELRERRNDGSIGVSTEGVGLEFDTTFARLYVRDTERWFKLATLGDGLSGTQLKLRTRLVDQERVGETPEIRFAEYTTSFPVRSRVYSTEPKRPEDFPEHLEFHVRPDRPSIAVHGASLQTSDASIVNGTSEWQFHVGGPENSRVETLLVFDVSELLPHVSRIDEELAVATLQFSHTHESNDDRLHIECLDVEPEFIQPGAGTPLLTAPAAVFGVVPGKGDLSQEIYEIDLREVLKHLLKSGKTRFALRIAAREGSLTSTPMRFAQASGERFHLRVTTKARPGLHADLYSEAGQLLTSGRAITDLRGMKAGGYLLRVYDPLTWTHERWNTRLPFEIEIVPPKVGESLSPTDQDELYGQEGHDLVVGNGFIDRLSGGPGLDAFEAQPLEIHDVHHIAGLPAFLQHGDATRTGLKTVQETVRSANVADTAIVDNLPLSIDKQLDWSRHPDLELLVGHALDLTVRTVDDQWRLRRPVRAGDLTHLQFLNLANRPQLADTSELSHLRHLEFATNLEYLAIAGSGIKHLSPLVPGIHKEGAENHSRFGQLGTPHLRYLDLDHTPISNKAISLATGNELPALSMLGQLEQLQWLSMDRLEGDSEYLFKHLPSADDRPFHRLTTLSAAGTAPVAADGSVADNERTFRTLEGLPLSGPDAAPLQYLNLSDNRLFDIRPLTSVDTLQWLDLSNNPLREIWPLAGIHVVDNSDRSFYHEEQGSGWSGETHPDALNQNYRLLAADLHGQWAEFQFKGLLPGEYEVFVTWPSHPSRATDARYRSSRYRWRARASDDRLLSLESWAASEAKLREALERQGHRDIEIERVFHRQLGTIDQTVMPEQMVPGDDGIVDRVVVTDPGNGYTEEPTVTLTGGGGSEATAEAVLRDGTVEHIRILKPGLGYSSPPEVQLTPASATPATAQAFLRHWAQFDSPASPRDYGWKQLDNTLTVSAVSGSDVSIFVSAGETGNLVTDAVCIRRIGTLSKLKVHNLHKSQPVPADHN